MSRTRIVAGKITEIIGNDYNIYSVENIEFHSQVQVTETAKEGIKFGEPQKAPPLEVVKIYAKTRLKEPYNGEFGFDWLDINPTSGDIEKIQGIFRFCFV
jgi:hypothetical protein